MPKKDLTSISPFPKELTESIRKRLGKQFGLPEKETELNSKDLKCDETTQTTNEDE